MDWTKKDFMWLWFVNIPGVGYRTRKKLLQLCTTPEQLYKQKESALSAVLTERMREAFAASKKETALMAYRNRLEDAGVTFLHWESKEYPEKLTELYDPPMGLYVKGRLPEKGRRSVAIVGARQADYYGTEMAAYFAKELARHKVNVISGLAYGVDGAAHRGALMEKGYTLGILGSGINICYPKEHYKLYHAMEQNGGLLSEYPLDQKPRAGLFPMRNRLIAAMSDGVLVTQARSKSGSLITVDQALELGREIFAVPGRLEDEMSQGCNELIRSGAKLVMGVEDLLEEWGMEVKEGGSFTLHRNNTLVNQEKMVYSVLRLEPKYIDTIIEETGLSLTALMPLLLHLQQQGDIRQPRRNYYSVVI